MRTLSGATFSGRQSRLIAMLMCGMSRIPAATAMGRTPDWVDTLMRELRAEVHVPDNATMVVLLAAAGEFNPELCRDTLGDAFARYESVVRVLSHKKLTLPQVQHLIDRISTHAKASRSSWRTGKLVGKDADIYAQIMESVGLVQDATTTDPYLLIMAAAVAAGVIRVEESGILPCNVAEQ